MRTFIPRRFDIGEEVVETDIEGRGHRWLVYWLLGQTDAHLYMTDGSAYVEIVNAHEWQALYHEAGTITSDPSAACDLACERLRWLLIRRKDWKRLL